MGSSIAVVVTWQSGLRMVMVWFKESRVVVVYVPVVASTTVFKLERRKSLPFLRGNAVNLWKNLRVT